MVKQFWGSEMEYLAVTEFTDQKTATGFPLIRASIHPHDLLWIDDIQTLMTEEPLPDRFNEYWHIGLPVIVRRDVSASGLIPIGIRGPHRHERAAAWIKPENVIRQVTPESLVSDLQTLTHSPFASTPPVQTLLILCQHTFKWPWGIIGSYAYTLATEPETIHAESDLDLLIRCPDPVEKTAFISLENCRKTLPCRTDIQIETPAGAFVMTEWLQNDRVLLKTNTGPILTRTPWQTQKNKS